MTKTPCAVRALLVFFILNLYQSSFSLPIRLAGELEKPVLETGVSVATAKVLMCNYQLLKRDFPYLRGRSHKQIDQWLIARAAYISVPQARNNEVNTPPFINPSQTVLALRPHGYGRATVLPVKGGLLDVKGTGVANHLVPENRSHANGLMSLGEAIREFTMQYLVETIFRHAKSKGYKSTAGQPLETVQSYAVIDWGFSIYDTFSPFRFQNGGLMRAGAIVRQAHARKMIPGSGNHFLPKNQANEVEDLLRSYGITTSGNIYDSVDIPDIQGTIDSRIFDFGTYVVMDRFSKDRTDPLGSEYFDDFEEAIPTRGQRLLSFSDLPQPSVLLKSLKLLTFESNQDDSFDDAYEYPLFQPNQRISIPFYHWGYNKRINPKGKCNLDNLRIMGEQFAQSLNESEIINLNRTSQIRTVLDTEYGTPLLKQSPGIAKISKKSGRDYASSTSLPPSLSADIMHSKVGLVSFVKLLEFKKRYQVKSRFESIRVELKNQVEYAFNVIFFKWYPHKSGIMIKARPTPTFY